MLLVIVLIVVLVAIDKLRFNKLAITALLAVALMIVVLLFLVPTDRSISERFDVPPDDWAFSPFQTDPNYIAFRGFRVREYLFKTTDTYGDPSLVNMNAGKTIFLGTPTKSVSVFRFNPTFSGFLFSLSWNPIFVVVMNSEIVLSGENNLLLDGATVFIMKGDKISPRLLSILGEDNEKLLMGLVESPLEEK